MKKIFDAISMNLLAVARELDPSALQLAPGKISLNSGEVTLVMHSGNPTITTTNNPETVMKRLTARMISLEVSGPSPKTVSDTSDFVFIHRHTVPDPSSGDMIAHFKTVEYPKRPQTRPLQTI